MKENRYKNLSSLINLDIGLKNKLNREEAHYYKNIMKNFTKEEIYNNAYEIAIRGEIVHAIRNLNLTNAEKEMLFLQDEIISPIYEDWLKVDYDISDLIDEPIYHSVERLTKYTKKRHQKDNRFHEKEL